MVRGAKTPKVKSLCIFKLKKPDIALTGLGVQKNHAKVIFDDGQFKIEPGASNAKVDFTPSKLY